MSYRWPRRAAALLACPLLSTCVSGFAQPDVPALIDKPSKESRAEITQAVSRTLNGAPVTLADDALTRESRLIVEKAHITGRDREKPEIFRLVKAGERCTLVHERTGQRTILPGTRCVPVN